METITIKDIARALNLSTSTVSRALRDSYEINPETKKTVLEYAMKMHYRPNPIALSLKENRSRSIGVIVPEIANNFFAQVINGIEEVAYNSGYHVVIFQSHESREREEINLDHLVSRKVDGILTSVSTFSQDISHFSSLAERGLPIVFIDRVPEEEKTFKVVANNYKGSYDATRHLLEYGSRKIAHITSPRHLSITRERLNGYKEALAEFGIEFNEKYVKYCEHGGMKTEEILEAAQELIDMEDRPDAIFAASDRITTGTMAVIHDNNLRIPEDIALVGFTNIAVAELLNPPLTTIVQPAVEMGQTAMQLLVDMIENPKKEFDFGLRKLDTTLVVRRSSLKK